MKPNLLVVHRPSILICGLAVMLIISCGTKDKKAVAEDKNYLIGMTGFDSLRLGMSKAELEAMVGDTFKLQHIKVDGGASDTIHTKYRGIDITVYLNEGDDKEIATVFGIRSNDPSFKTRGGVGVGTEKEKVISAYEDFTKYIAPEYEVYPERSKTKSCISVMDTATTGALLFHIIDRKVSSVELTSYYEFD
jgi:hypothetical protein